jgi:plastocyanin
VSGDFRKRVLGPALIPLGAFAFIGALVYPMSRILLAVTKDGSVVVAVLMAASILFACGAVAKGGTIKSVQKVGLIAFALLLFGGGVAVEASLGPRAVEGHLEKGATLTAQNISFDLKDLVLPADKGFILEFINKDNVQHNVAIYKDKAASSSGEAAGTLFKGAVFQGPATRDYEIKDGIPKGTYYFQCDIHPVMNGVAHAGEAPAGTPPSTPPPTATAAPSSPLPSPTAPTGPVVLALTAHGIAFDKTQLSFPANSQVAIDFDNQDPSTQHNWALYSDAEFTQALFHGEVITGPSQKRYEFTSPAAGTYYFKCDIHPAMKGTATVT